MRSCRSWSTPRAAWDLLTPTAAAASIVARSLVERRAAAGDCAALSRGAAAISARTCPPPNLRRCRPPIAEPDSAERLQAVRRSLPRPCPLPASSWSATAATTAAWTRSPRRRRVHRFMRSGIGPKASPRDREVVSVTAAESVLSDTVTDLAVSAVSPWLRRRTDRAAPARKWPRRFDVRRVHPAADGVAGQPDVPRVAESRCAHRLYRRDPGRRPTSSSLRTTRAACWCRRPAVRGGSCSSQGAPGFEHSFLSGRWAADRGLEVDSVVRKGRDDAGADTFYVQAARSRADALLGGFPKTPRGALRLRRGRAGQRRRRDLLTAQQLALTRAFVAERGGGLLVLGARAFQRQGLRDTALEDVLPLELTDRGGGRAARPRLAGTQPRRAHARRARTTRSCNWRRHPTTTRSAGPRSRAGRGVAARRRAARRERAGRHRRPRRSAARAGRGAALRRRPIDGLYRRSVVALAHDAAVGRSVRTTVLAAGRAMAGAGLTGPGFVAGAGAAGAGDVPVVIDARTPSFAPERDATVDLRITGPGGRVETARAQSSPRIQAVIARTCTPRRPASIASRRRREWEPRRSVRRPVPSLSAASIPR